MTLFMENESGYEPDFNLEEVAKTVIDHILKMENCPFECEINLTVTDNEGIRVINKEFREIDSATDVLSFPGVAFETPSDFDALMKTPDYFYGTNPDTGNFMLGDMMISSERVISQAKDYGHNEKREFAFLVAHSTLHLLGYDHMTDEDAKVMEAKQDQYLKDLDINR